MAVVKVRESFPDVRARSIFGDVHDRHAFADCKRHRVFRQFQQFVERPVFCKNTYGRGADEGASFDRNTNPLGDFDDWQDIVSVSTGSAIRADLQFLARQSHEPSTPRQPRECRLRRASQYPQCRCPARPSE